MFDREVSYPHAGDGTSREEIRSEVATIYFVRMMYYHIIDDMESARLWAMEIARVAIRLRTFIVSVKQSGSLSE